MSSNKYYLENRPFGQSQLGGDILTSEQRTQF
jgi:hypothetical protein